MFDDLTPEAFNYIKQHPCTYEYKTTDTLYICPQRVEGMIPFRVFFFVGGGVYAYKFPQNETRDDDISLNLNQSKYKRLTFFTQKIDLALLILANESGK